MGSGRGGGVQLPSSPKSPKSSMLPMKSEMWLRMESSSVMGLLLPMG